MPVNTDIRNTMMTIQIWLATPIPAFASGPHARSGPPPTSPAPSRVGPVPAPTAGQPTEGAGGFNGVWTDNAQNEHSVLIDGAPSALRSPVRANRRGIAYVPQGRRVWPSLTVDETLRLVARLTVLNIVLVLSMIVLGILFTVCIVMPMQTLIGGVSGGK